MAFKTTDEPLTTRLYIRFSEPQKKQLRENAEQCLVSMSEFVRRASLGKRIIPRTDYQMLNELRRQGGNLRNLLSSKIDGAKDKEIALAAIEALRDIVRVIDKAIDFEGDEQ